MKKCLSTCLTLLVSGICLGQSNTFPPSGNAGIGTTTPSANLDFYRIYSPSQPKVLKMFYEGSWGYVSYADEFRFIDIQSTEGGKVMQLNGYGLGLGFDPPSITTNDKLYVNGRVGFGTRNPIGSFDTRGATFIGTTDLVQGSSGSFLQLDQGASSGNTYSQIRAFNYGGNAIANLALQTSGGNVGIGTASPSEKLSVNGRIRAKEIKVEVATWPDYVFEKSYELPALKDIEKHIRLKGHLPGIPSETEAKANGIELGEMNAKLLEKIEELTLHLIRKEEQLSEQLKMIENQEQRLQKLEGQSKF